MGYPRELDEVPTQELRDELARREQNVLDGLCDYCGKGPGSSPCRFPERHNEMESYVALVNRNNAAAKGEKCHQCGEPIGQCSGHAMENRGKR